MNIAEILEAGPVICVLTLEGRRDAVPVAQALVAGGLRVLEVTLRTPGALDAIRAIRAEVPEALIGAGTVLDVGQLRDAERAGAQFIVSPGCTDKLLAAAEGSVLPWLPGAATASEVMTLAGQGYTFQKFFPAEVSGGTAFLRSICAPLPEVRFCPTGGIDARKAVEYLGLPNVACVGGSWPVPAQALKDGNWELIRTLAREASGLRLNRNVI